MAEEMEAMITKLELAQNMEQMAELENQIAEELGRGFLHGKYDYAYLIQTKEKVEQVETACRNIFKPQIANPEKHITRSR